MQFAKPSITFNAGGHGIVYNMSFAVLLQILVFSPDYSVQYKNLAAEQSIDVTKSSTNPLVYSPRNNEIISFPRKCIYSGNKRFRQVDR